MLRSHRPALFVCTLFLALTMSSSAFGQATRTWVSGVGDDANPCSRTAPCKTFAGSISKTAAGGEINVLDPGGFGAVTITKSISIISHSPTAGVLTNAANGINISAGASDRIYLRGLDFNGLGTASSGIKINSAARVIIRDSAFYRFQSAITSIVTTNGTHVIVTGNQIHNNGIGVFSAPGSSAIGSLTTTVRQNDFNDNTCALVASSRGGGSAPQAATNCGVVDNGFNLPTVTEVFSNGFNDNALGLQASGPNSLIEYGDNDITGNAVPLRRNDSGVLRTFGDNHITNNGPGDAPNGTVAPSR